MVQTPKTAIPLAYDRIAAFCQKHHIQRLWVFGSALNERFDSDSDVDMLVEFSPEYIPGWEFFSWIEELSEIVGRKVDLTTPRALSPYIKSSVMDAARVIYERT
jgi:predicted nucleotidyltransferase